MLIDVLGVAPAIALIVFILVPAVLGVDASGVVNAIWVVMDIWVSDDIVGPVGVIDRVGDKVGILEVIREFIDRAIELPNNNISISMMVVGMSIRISIGVMMIITCWSHPLRTRTCRPSTGHTRARRRRPCR